MIMDKDKIKKILRKYVTVINDENYIPQYAIPDKKIPNIVADLVKLFAIPVVIAYYSLPKDFEERLARYLELVYMLKEDGLKPEDYDEYCELKEEIKDEYF
jgi:hypothetical protein